MAITGLMMFGFLIGHMVGHLQMFKALGGASQYNAYAKFLKGTPSLLWGTRITLLLAIGLHIWSFVQLRKLNAAARPVGYDVPIKRKRSTLMSRTMVITGPVLALFIVVHLLQFTVAGSLFLDGFDNKSIYRSMVITFKNPIWTLLYVAVLAGLAGHLRHGLYSFFQSLGWTHPTYNRLREHFAMAFTILVTVGFAIVPLAIMFRLIS